MVSNALKSIGLFVAVIATLILVVDRSSWEIFAMILGAGLSAFIIGLFGLVLVDIEEHLRSLASKIPTATIAGDAPRPTTGVIAEPGSPVA